MSIVIDQLKVLTNLFIRDKMKAGSVPAPDEVRDYLGVVSERVGKPMMAPRAVAKGMKSNSKLFNLTWKETKFDLDFLFDQVKQGSLKVIRDYQFNATQQAGLVAQVMRIKRDINSILLVHDRTTGMLDNIYEDFTDLDRIDTTKTSAEVDTTFRLVRIGSLGQGSKVYLGDAAGADVKIAASETLEGKGVSAVLFTKMDGSSDEKAILNDMVNDFWGVTVSKETDAPILWSVNITLPDVQDITTLQLTTKARTNIDAGLNIINEAGESTFLGVRMSTGNAEWRFPVQKAKKITFTITTRDSKPNGALHDFYLMITNVSMYLDLTKAQSDLYTNAMPLEMNQEVGRVSLSTQQEGRVDWFINSTFEKGTVTEESGWVPIIPLDQAKAGDPVVFGSLMHKKPYLLPAQSDAMGTLSDEIANDVIVDKSIKVTAGADLWRVDFHDVSLVDGRYVLGPEALDLSLAHTGYMPVDEMPIDTDANVTPHGLFLEMFHRWRLCTVLYMDPDLYPAPVAKDMRIRFQVNSMGLVGSDNYADPILEVHSLQANAGVVTGITTARVQFSKTYIPSLQCWEYIGPALISPGINYITINLDTGVDSPAFSQSTYDQMKFLKCKLALAVRDNQSWVSIDSLAGDAGHFIAGTGDPADFQMYRNIVPFSKLSNKMAADYYSAALDVTEYSDGHNSSRIFLNHPFMEFVLNGQANVAPRPAPATPIATKFLVEYDTLQKKVISVKLHAVLKRENDVLPTISNFTLRFSL